MESAVRGADDEGASLCTVRHLLAVPMPAVTVPTELVVRGTTGPPQRR